MSPRLLRVAGNVALALSVTWVMAVSADVLLNPLVRRGNKLAVIERLSRRGRPAVPEVMPVTFVGDAMFPPTIEVDGRPTLPLSGLSRRTTVGCREAGDWLVYEADEHGFQNPPGLWERPSLDAVAFGDSYTQGDCVGPDQNMVARLRLYSPDTLNLGRGGNGPLLTLATMREYLPHLHASAVLWCHYGGNDLHELAGERAHPILVRYLEDEAFTQDLFLRQPAIDRAMEEQVLGRLTALMRRRTGWTAIARRALALGHLRARVVQAVSAPGGPPLAPVYPAGESEYALLRRILARAQRFAAAGGSRFYFVYLPDWACLFRADAAGQLARDQHDRVLGLVRELRIPAIDLLADFRAGGKGLFACPTCHYGPEGYALAGDRIASVLAGKERAASN